MTRHDLERLEELYLAACELPADELDAFLDESCAEEAELRGELERLLAAADRPTGLLSVPPRDAARLPDGRVVVVGLEGTVLVQHDDSYRELQLPDRSGLTAVMVPDGEHLVLAGDGGLLRVRLDELRERSESG